MVHACPTCGGDATRQAWAAGGDGDTRALRDLAEQRRATASPELRSLLQSVADQIRTQRDGLTALERGLKQAYRDVLRALVEELLATAGNDISERARRLGLSAQALADALVVALDEARSDFGDVRAELVILTELQLELGGVDTSPDLEAITAASQRLDEDFWGSTIVQPTAERMWDGVASAVRGDSLEDVARRIQRVTDRSLGQAMTEAATQLAEFDRAVTASTAERAGVAMFAYLGPSDRLTRPFCAVLVNKLVSRAQVVSLDNAQTVTSPLISGGGYRCRHSWAPVSPAMAGAMGLPRAKAADIRQANSRARRGR